MIRQIRSIVISFCILCLLFAGICFAQDYSSRSDPVDCASLVSSGQNAEAFGCFGRAIEEDPSSALDWAGQGDVMNNIGYYYQALIYYEMAINLDPYSANILTSKGRTLTRLGEYNDAMSSFNKALDLQPDNAYTWESIGDLYSLQNDTVKAQAAYSKAKLGKQRQSVEDYLSRSQGNDIKQPTPQSITP